VSWGYHDCKRTTSAPVTDSLPSFGSNISEKYLTKTSFQWSIDQDNTAGNSMNDLMGIGTANGVSEAAAASFKEQMANATLQNAVASSCSGSLNLYGQTTSAVSKRDGSKTGLVLYAGGHAVEKRGAGLTALIAGELGALGIAEFLPSALGHSCLSAYPLLGRGQYALLRPLPALLLRPSSGGLFFPT
jgi:hypothetical protein